MLKSTDTMETLSLISIQHELAMNIGLSPKLKPMVRGFMEVCLRRLDIRRAHLFLRPSQLADSSGDNKITNSEHIRISMPDDDTSCSIYDLIEQSTLPFHRFLNDSHPITLKDENVFFYFFPIVDMGTIIFERINFPFPDKLLQALIPIVERLGAACKAAMQHEQILKEIVRRKEAEKRIKHLAYYDALTGLPNRRNLLMKMTEVTARENCAGIKGMLMYVDLDNFKDINDSLGYLIGDSVVREMANRFGRSEFDGLTVARLGSDEFGVLVPVSDGTVENIRAYGAEMARVIQNTIAEPCILGERTCMLSASVGIVFLEDNETPVDVLLGQGNQAMYQAKALGRHTVQFFDIKRKEDIENRLLLDSEMRTALDEGQFTLFLQPQVDENGQVLGSEALIRWHHPDKGMVSPASFVPMAEKSGFIIPISDWVLEQACGYINELERQGLLKATTHIAVNLSAKYFHQADFVARVTETFERKGTDPQRIELEITESTLINNTEETVDKINQLRKLGIQFSIDDFGTGYSSIAYLKQLPIDRVKIDRSFVRDVHTSPDDAAIVETIISMAKHFQLQVVAEGVENAAEWEFLKNQGCRLFQGFYFYRPLPFSSYTELLLGME